LLIVLNNGCTVGPDYQMPKSVTPDAFQNVPILDATATNDLARWWKVFRDPQLDDLILRAADANLDLKLAEARIRETRALRGQSRSGFYPAIGTSSSYGRSLISENSINGAGLNQFGIPLELDIFSTGFDMTWELDVFGGTRRNVEATSADLAAAGEYRNEARVSVLAEVGLNYLELRGLQRQLTITRDNLGIQEQSADIARDRLEAGLSSELDVSRAVAQVERTRSMLPPLEEGIQRTIHRLSVLLGTPPAALASEFVSADKLSIGTKLETPGVPVGLPSDLVRRRPDVRKAERQLAAANARVGVAIASMFPKFYLTGAAGLQSIEATDFLDGGSRFWTLGPTIQWPIFNAGQIRQGISVQEARQEQALIRYEQTVLTSFEEVENALVSFGKEQDRHRALFKSESASQRSVSLAYSQHRAGLVDFLHVLTAERELLGIQEELTQSNRRLGQNLIRLYKALGGGWETAVPISLTTDRTIPETPGVSPTFGTDSVFWKNSSLQIL
jgi:NodT family efflux transporter outer membrane factor (OMF) lipoprotein